MSSEEHLRAGTYSLLAALLRAPPANDLLARLQGIAASAAAANAMGAAWANLKQAAARAEPAALDDEYHELFIGIGRGALVPFGSWYLTGFLMEKPLSTLRRDLARLGYERQDAVREPEDHVAALCEVMALLIMDPDLPFATQRAFFEAHIGPWMGRFFRDLSQAPAARFYRAVGHVGYEFIGLEQQYLAMLV